MVLKFPANMDLEMPLFSKGGRSCQGGQRTEKSYKLESVVLNKQYWDGQLRDLDSRSCSGT